MDESHICWWSDLPKEWCAHCKGIYGLDGEDIE